MRIQIVRLNFKSFVPLSDRLSHFPLLGKGDTEIIQRFSIPGIQLQRCLQLTARRAWFPFTQESIRAIVVASRDTSVGFDFCFLLTNGYIDAALLTKTSRDLAI